VILDRFQSQCGRVIASETKPENAFRARRFLFYNNLKIERNHLIDKVIHPTTGLRKLRHMASKSDLPCSIPCLAKAGSA